jgi:thioredoxin
MNHLLYRIAILLVSLFPVNAFLVKPLHYHAARLTLALHSEVASLRVSEIKKELNERNVNYADCFDKESLIVKLENARAGGVQPATTVGVADESTTSSTAKTATNSQEPLSSRSKPSSSNLLQELGQKSVKELRQELASRNLGWASFLEKKELIQAVFDAMQADADFSATGLMTPGQVCDLSQEELRLEISSDKPTPLLVDVYATWCGPCQLMTKQLQEAASELGSSVRVAKLDSDQNQKLAAELKVQGLPTLILFENGEEVKRMEGAIMKDQLIEWVVEE